MVFWDSWQLWLKLVFVLSIAIVCTVIAGVLKLIYDQYKIRQFTRIEKEKMEDQPMVEEFARQRRGRQETPFGIRAIESGIEVEGVWISRNNSPASSTPGSPMLSPQAKGKAVSKGDVPALQMPEQSHPYQDRSRSPNGSVGSFERATSAERIETGSAGSSEYVPVTRSTYKPRLPSALRYSTADDLQADPLPPRSGSGSSEGSSEGSNPGQQHLSPSGYQQVKQPVYYQPTGMTSYNSVPPISPAARTSPEHGQPGRSNRSSYAAQNYMHAVADTNQPPAPQRFYQPTESPTQLRDPFANAEPINRSMKQPVLEAIELTDNPKMGNPPVDKTKRIPRKLQKKN